MSHIDPDCEVVRGVGWMCTCETPEGKTADAKYRAECEAERDARELQSDNAAHALSKMGPADLPLAAGVRAVVTLIENGLTDASHIGNLLTLALDYAAKCDGTHACPRCANPECWNQ